MDIENQIYITLFKIYFPISMFFTIGSYALLNIIFNKKRLEAINIIIWGFVGGFIGMIAYGIYYGLFIETTNNLVGLSVLGFLSIGGYSMLLFFVVNQWRNKNT